MAALARATTSATCGAAAEVSKNAGRAVAVTPSGPLMSGFILLSLVGPCELKDSKSHVFQLIAPTVNPPTASPPFGMLLEVMTYFIELAPFTKRSKVTAVVASNFVIAI